MKKLSIIVPVYKVEDYLEKCVQSLLSGIGETYLDQTEIILVDDGSPDNCPAICDNLEKRYNNIKVVHQKNAGVSSARNTGIKNATGEYITFCDSDDFVEENFNKVFDYINTNPDVDVFSVGIKKNNLIISKFKDEILSSNNFKDLYKIAKKDVTISCCAKIVKRELIIKNNIYFPDGIKSEDLVWSYMLLFNCNKYMITDLVYYNYVDRQTSVTHSTSLNGIISQVKNFRRLKDLVLSLNLTIKQQKKLLRHLMKGYIYSIYTIKFLNSNDKQYAKKIFMDNKDLIYPPHGLKLFLYYLFIKIFNF